MHTIVPKSVAVHGLQPVTVWQVIFDTTDDYRVVCVCRDAQHAANVASWLNGGDCHAALSQPIIWQEPALPVQLPKSLADFQ